MRVMRKATIVAAVGMLALPASALAVDTTSQVTGAIGSELSLSVATPAAMTMTHAQAGATSSLVTVTSTELSWTLSIRDASATTPGQMDRLTGTGPSSLASPLQWRLSGASSYNNLSGTAATVKSGTLIDTALVEFNQPLGASEAVNATDTYGLTATYTVS